MLLFFPGLPCLPHPSPSPSTAEDVQRAAVDRSGGDHRAVPGRGLLPRGRGSQGEGLDPQGRGQWLGMGMLGMLGAGVCCI